MKVIILAGGLGTRLSEETADKPKPMVEISGVPIVFRIFQIFAKQGHCDFVLALGYKGYVINDWLAKLSLQIIKEGELENKFLIRVDEKLCTVTTLNTGIDTLTGGRVFHCLEYIDEELVFLTYGDGLANVNLQALVQFHETHNKIATLTAVQPPPRFGYLEISGNTIVDFSEKMHSKKEWINGGFMIINRKMIEFLSPESGSFEYEALPKIARINELKAHFHEGFWQPMDTLREKNELSELAKLDPPPWLDFD
jgi:glucose-1-phosphate cytidylyltransferase